MKICGAQMPKRNLYIKIEMYIHQGQKGPSKRQIWPKTKKWAWPRPDELETNRGAGVGERLYCIYKSLPIEEPLYIHIPASGSLGMGRYPRLVMDRTLQIWTRILDTYIYSLSFRIYVTYPEFPQECFLKQSLLRNNTMLQIQNIFCVQYICIRTLIFI